MKAIALAVFLLLCATQAQAQYVVMQYTDGSYRWINTGQYQQSTMTVPGGGLGAFTTDRSAFAGVEYNGVFVGAYAALPEPRNRRTTFFNQFFRWWR